MSHFDPTKHQSDDFQNLAAGLYLVAMTKFERKQAQKSGQDYLRATFKVIHGRSKGQVFFSSVGLDVSNPGTATRLGLYCRAVGVTEAFDLSSDRAIGRALLGKPFKAQIKVTTNGQYVNNDVQKYVFELTTDEQIAGEEWWSEWVAKAAENEDSGDFEDGDGDGFDQAYGTGAPNRSDDGDSDIPF